MIRIISFAPGQSMGLFINNVNQYFAILTPTPLAGHFSKSGRTFLKSGCKSGRTIPKSGRTISKSTSTVRGGLILG